MKATSLVSAAICQISILLVPAAGSAKQLTPMGVAKVDITPDYSIRLSGYGNRQTESEGIEQRIWAKALAIGSDDQGPVVLVTVDNCGVPRHVTDEVGRRLFNRAGIRAERIAVFSSHTHCAPMLSGVLPLIFGSPIPADQQRRIEQYTGELTDKIEQVVLSALADRQPGRLDWTVGNVSFAINRRSQKKGLEGPVDHTLPMLRVLDEHGKPRAILVRYTCHAVSLFGDFNRICGDWPGYAQAAIEQNRPGCIAMVTIGCAGDQKPNLQSKLVHAQQHGAAIAQEVDRLFEQDNFKPLSGSIRARLETIDLPFEPLPTRDEWIRRAERGGREGFHARAQLERLEQGQPLQQSIPYPVQTWTFGDELAMVNLAGEVVVDYALRLDREFDRGRLWINAYANDVPCYIPSKQVLQEGGYEPDRSMLSYDRPAKFAPEVEDLIADVVQRLTPAEFYSESRQLDFPAPNSPESSRQSMQARGGLRVELMAAEPLVVDPVAIDFGVDGRLWVAEYLDYPTGVDENYLPGGRIKVLTDTNADGRYDKATVFLADVPFPTGLMEWRGGVLIASAPDILYARDTNGDGKADVRKVLFTGFVSDNFQARVNGFRLGLDNFVHGSSGRRAKLIRRIKHLDETGDPSPAAWRPIELGSRDFRMDPDAGVLEAVAGGSQNARIRDDWGNWFGSTAGGLLFHYPLPDHYVRRNPYLAAPPPQVLVPAGGESAMRLFPISRTLSRFNNPLHFNRVTSACGPTILRDTFLGAELYGAALICEPVHNVVTRRQLRQHGLTFQGHRVKDESHSELLASTDSWFRPVQVRTGPNGGLWVVDMYRFVIEHPRWIGPERLRKLDVRAGDDKGRLYCLYPAGSELRPLPNLQVQSTEQLAKLIDNPNGVLRDLIHRELLHRGEPDAIATLQRVAGLSPHPAARLQALCVLDGLGGLTTEILQGALADTNADVRRHAIRLSEGWLGEHPALASAVLAQSDAKDLGVRMQLAMSLGEWRDPRAGRALAKLVPACRTDPYFRAALLSSAPPHLSDLLAALLENGREFEHVDLLEELVQVAISVEEFEALTNVFRRVATPADGRELDKTFRVLAAILDGLQRDNMSLNELTDSAGTELRRAMEPLRGVFRRATVIALDERSPLQQRVQAIRLVSRGLDPNKADSKLLLSLLSPRQPALIQSSAISALGRLHDDSTVDPLIAGWRRYSPATRSRVLDELLRRRAWLARAMHAIASGKLPPTDVNAAQRALLLDHTDQRIREQARSIFDARSAPRHAVVQEYQSVVNLQGSSPRGRDVFVKHCAKCHRFDGTGHQVGPDLATLSNRSATELLIAVLDPNRAVEPRYQSYACATSDGRVISGTLGAETATSITLLAADGKTEVILRSEIEDLASTGKSLMPEGVEKDLTNLDLADLFAYLQPSKLARKRLPGNQPALIRANQSGLFTLVPENAAIYGSTLQLAQPKGRVTALTQWKSANDRAIWEVALDSSGDYEVWLDSMCDEGVTGNEFVIQVDGANQTGITDRTISTVGEDNWYRSRNLGTLALPAGSHHISIRARGAVTGTLFHLRAVTLVPAAR